MKRLRTYQRDAVLNYMMDFQHPVLFWEMRVGKATTSCGYLRNKPDAKTVLIVAPYSSHHDWILELEEELSEVPIILCGTKKDRQYLLEDGMVNGTRIFIINTEGWRFLDLTQVDWDCIIMDEAHCLANPKSKITKYFHRNFRDVKYRLALTGSDYKKNLLEVFGPLYWADPRILGFKDYWTFRLSKFKQGAFTWEPKPGTREWIADRISNWCLKIKRSDVNIGTKKLYKRVMVDFTRDFRNHYEKLERSFVLLEESTKSAGVKHSWMLQLCSGFIDDTLHWHGKMTELHNLMSGGLRGEPIIIWSRFVNDIEAIAKRFKMPLIYGDTPKPERLRLISDFQKGKLDKIVLQPACMRMGVNLSRASASLYYSQPNGQEHREQSEDRVVPGEIANKADAGKLIVDFIVPNTVDYDTHIGQKAKKTEKQIFHMTVQRFKRNRNAKKIFGA